jgi:hypothetical protein
MTFNVTGNVTSRKNITDLYPWTTYMFCIAAQTTSGKGADICQEQQTLQVCCTCSYIITDYISSNYSVWLAWFPPV